MATLKEKEAVIESIGDKRTRYLAHTDTLMMVVIDFNDGPTSEPDPPHDHPHEQISYVVAGEVILFFRRGTHSARSGGYFYRTAEHAAFCKIAEQSCPIG